MSELILGIHAGHNATACIGDERGLLYAVQEERLTHEKNFWGLPQQAVRACLKATGASPGELRAVVTGAEQVLWQYHSREDILRSYQRQETFGGRLRQRVVMPAAIRLMPRTGRRGLLAFLEAEGLDAVPLRQYPHHFAHAATAYYGLRADPDEPYLVLTCDGDGDGACATVGVFGDGDRKEIARTDWANSLGALYAWITYGMGFVPLEHEYKLMGMAAYASEDAATETAAVFHKHLGLDGSGLRLQRRQRRRTNDLYPTLERELRGKRFDHVCAGLQRFTEDILAEWTSNAVQATGVGRVLASGGVFMNVKANKRLAELPEVTSFEAFPSCGDETLPMGAFWLALAEAVGDTAVPPLSSFYLGDDLDPAEIHGALSRRSYRSEQPADMARAVVDLLLSGEPVARCAGSMEFGARALGNRSILADPSNGDVVRVINQMVKKRDFWMPFAPIIKADRQHDYIQNPKALRSPYMMMTFDTTSKVPEMIAAAHGADLTCRPQILEQHQNPEMYAILEEFEARTGSGVLLNTSFNLHGFPIVRTAEEALSVLDGSGLNHLQLGATLVHKS